ncbi:uncharacterized protein BP01DRAFT_386933 [Aspergillus saccharolyticus JOP 1030-1]|uniref:Calcineurin-like phosphoesterase domain-containing protein n=1 Tax=Aspergillus saccharolyticus JOP 1030-1 TaxID=1450539 RepID=A0A318Z0V5_9EURO|nr:hypothetical protein BP01DRAFT_386933 [Aspergillus saccharolyticus JOP 1030-1]PYH40915.1 hypothetical protein BP01DRAFT_386933 [Aspergillus saccharolyticus JOP 1030-1]
MSSNTDEAKNPTVQKPVRTYRRDYEVEFDGVKQHIKEERQEYATPRPGFAVHDSSVIRRAPAEFPLAISGPAHQDSPRYMTRSARRNTVVIRESREINSATSFSRYVSVREEELYSPDTTSRTSEEACSTDTEDSDSGGGKPIRGIKSAGASTSDKALDSGEEGPSQGTRSAEASDSGQKSDDGGKGFRKVEIEGANSTSLLCRLLALLVPLAVTSSLYLYLYPVVHGCAFPLPHDSLSRANAFLATVRQHIPTDAEPAPAAPFRLLVLADPQLEGDSSLPKPEDELPARLRHHWAQIRAACSSPPPSLNSTAATDADANAESTPDTLPSNISESNAEPLHNDSDINLPLNQSTFRTINLRATKQAITAALHSLLHTDLPRTFKAARKRLDLLGNDYYLAHIYRTLHWWTQPTHVTVLGDLIGSQWVSDEEFERRGQRYWERVFRGGVRGDNFIPPPSPPSSLAHTDNTTENQNIINNNTLALTATTHPSPWTNRILNIVGNHDIGYAGDASAARISRFESTFGQVNWDVKFWLNSSGLDTDTTPQNSPPQIHIINLNSLTLDTPAYSPDIQSASYEYLNGLIADRLAPVTDRSTFTLLLTHLPLHKREGVCVDAPLFKFFEEDDGGDGVDGKEKRWFAGGLREQNHLSEWVSGNGVLEGVFGMSGEEGEAVVGGGGGRKGLVLTGHDHEGCDVLHFVRRRKGEVGGESDVDGEAEAEADGKEAKDENDSEDGADERDWEWDARRYSPQAQAETSTPSIREVTMRSMMGAYGGYAGLLSVWFDTDKQEWEYEIQMCAAGVQHIWWAVHVVDLVTLGIGLVALLLKVFMPLKHTHQLQGKKDGADRRPQKTKT